MNRRATWFGIGLSLLAAVTASADPQRDRPVSQQSSTATDLALVKRVIAARREYQMSLEQLRAYYGSVGDTDRVHAVEEELKQFHRVTKPAYIIDLDIAGPGLRPDQNVPAANDLYRKAMGFKGKGLGSEYTDNQIRAELLLQQLLQQYPTSNKCSDAAYHLAEMYETRKPPQYRRAAVYFERCCQWNPTTTLDARIRAAQLYDRHINDRNKAIELYQSVLSHETNEQRRQEAQRRLGDLGIK
jgi:TolA-binding protein